MIVPPVKVVIEDKPIISVFDGQPIKDETVNSIKSAVLLSLTRWSDPTEDGAKKWQAFRLAEAVAENQGIEATDISTIRERVGRIFTPEIVGAVWRYLDQLILTSRPEAETHEHVDG